MQSVNKGVSLYKNGKVFEENKQYLLMEKFYIEAIKKYKNSDALISLLNYYLHNKNEYKFNLYFDIALNMQDKNIYHFIGLYYKDVNDIENQEKYFELAMKNGNVSSMYLLAEIYVKKKLYQNIDEYFKFLSHNGNLDATIELINKYKNNDIDQWIYYCFKAKDYGELSFIFDLAMYYKTNKIYEKMEELLLLLINNLNHKESFDEIKNYYSETKQYEKLMNIYIILIKLEPKNVSNKIDMAKLYNTLENFQECENIFLSLIFLEYNIDALIEFAIYYKNRGKIDDMVKYLYMAARKGSDKAYFMLGNYYKTLNMIDKMETSYSNSGYSGNIDAIYELIQLYIDKNQINCIYRWCEILIKKIDINSNSNSNNLSFEFEFYINSNDKLLSICNALEKANIYDQAFEIYKKLKNYESIYRMGCIFMDKYNDFDKAIECFSKNIIINHINSIYKLGIIYEIKKDYENMEFFFDKTISLNNHSEAIFKLALHNLINTQNYEKTMKYALSGINIHNDTRCMEIAGNCSFLIKKYDDIEKYYLQITKINENNERINMKLASYYEIIKKNLDYAIKYYQLCTNNFSLLLKKCNIIREESTCAVCYDDFTHLCKLNMCCNQLVCLKCIRELLNNKNIFKCPFCREIIKFEQFYKIERYGIKYGESLEDLDNQDNEENHVLYNENNFIDGIYYADG